MTNKEIEKTIVYQIDGIALFEDRRYYRATCERFLFIEKTYLKEFNETLNYIPTLRPTSLIDENNYQFVHITELKPLLSIIDYNNLLCNILELSNEYDKINIIFPYLVENNDFTSESINRIIEYSLKSKTVRNAFEAQSHMLELVYKNKKKINSTLFHKALSDFPHKSGGLGWVDTSKL